MSGVRLSLPLADAAATEALGAALAQWLKVRGAGLLALRGDLGAGKTTLARGLLRALGATGAVRSPSYTLLEPYRFDGLRVLHMDFYRLQSAEELENLGLRDDPPDRCVWLVEWPERAAGVLPQPDLDLQLLREGEGRRARLECRDAESAGLISAMARQGLIAEIQKNS